MKSFYEVNGIWSLDSEFRQALTPKVHMESGAYEITLDRILTRSDCTVPLRFSLMENTGNLNKKTKSYDSVTCK